MDSRRQSTFLRRGTWLNALRSALAEPRAANPPPRSRWDVALCVALMVLAVPSALFEPDLAWRPVALVLGVVVGPAVLFRRSHPLGALAVVFAVVSILDVASWRVADGSVVVGSIGLGGLILFYAVGRWGSGREVAIGAGLALSSTVFDLIAGRDLPLAEILADSTVWLFAGAAGLAVRYRMSLRERRTADAQLRERELLARELHDTVAHHVSAIAIQAQAGQAVAASRPEAAVEILQTIEESASRTLADMRRMVGILRDPATGPELKPASGLDQIAGLAVARPGSPPVEVELSGDLEDLEPEVEASLFRVAQEAVTNARRHARHATRITVAVDGDESEVKLIVTDDGDLQTGVRSRNTGFGVLGMSERALLLGGTFRAQPGPVRGWVVEAALPRSRGVA